MAAERRGEPHALSKLPGFGVAAVVLGQTMPGNGEPADELRQLGYAATMAKGRVPDPDGRLNAAIKACRAAVARLEAPVVEGARDAQ
jgi:hypothetical protein